MQLLQEETRCRFKRGCHNGQVFRQTYLSYFALQQGDRAKHDRIPTEKRTAQSAPIGRVSLGIEACETKTRGRRHVQFALHQGAHTETVRTGPADTDGNVDTGIHRVLCVQTTPILRDEPPPRQDVRHFDSTSHACRAAAYREETARRGVPDTGRATRKARKKIRRGFRGVWPFDCKAPRANAEGAAATRSPKD